MKALIQNNKVIDVQKSEFEVHSSLSWVDCGDSVEIGYSYDGSKFTSGIVPQTSEQKLQDLRRSRDTMLAVTDWVVTMHKELGTNIPSAMKTYRQALRDITDSATSLDDVTWPTKPS